jgi:hypothetical protein
MLYTIRYRCHRTSQDTALIVEDRRGASYLFSQGHLQLRLRVPNAGARLASLLATRGDWNRVPLAEPYTLAELARLVGDTPLPSAA